MAAENLPAGPGPTDLESLRPADDQGLSELDTEHLMSTAKVTQASMDFLQIRRTLKFLQISQKHPPVSRHIQVLALYLR